MAKSHAERQRDYIQRQKEKVSKVQQMADAMFEFIKREAHYYQERNRHPSQYTDAMDYMYRQERAKIIEAVLSGNDYRPEFEYGPVSKAPVGDEEVLTTNRKIGRKLASSVREDHGYHDDRYREYMQRRLDESEQDSRGG